MKIRIKIRKKAGKIKEGKGQKRKTKSLRKLLKKKKA
jgi:hypothetical protein